MKTPWNRAVLLPSALSFLVLLSGGCHEKQAPEPLSTNAVATVGTKAILRADFEREWAKRSNSHRGVDEELRAKLELLESLIGVEALYQRAVQAGFDQDPGIQADLRRMIVSKYQEKLSLAWEEAPIPAEDLEQYYWNNKPRFTRPERVRAAVIELRVARNAPMHKRSEVAEKARRLLAEANRNKAEAGAFEVLVQNHSEHQSSRYKGGDIGWITAGTKDVVWGPEVVKAIFKLNTPGAAGPIVETPEGFYLVKLIERQPAVTRPFEEVRAGIEYLVRKEKEHKRYDALLGEAVQGVAIRTNWTLLEAITVPGRVASVPPGLTLPNQPPGGN